MSDPIIDALNRLRADVDSLLEREVTRYVEGAWTPAFAGTGTAGVYTYSNQFGYYIRVGNLVSFFGRLTITAIGTPPVGSMTVTGLPLTVNATYPGSVSFAFISQFNNAASAIQLTGIVSVGTTRFDLYESFDNGATVAAPAGNFTNTATDVIFSGFYFV